MSCRSPTIVLCATLLMGGPVLAAEDAPADRAQRDAGPRRDAPSDPGSVESYWTREKMESAKPMPTPGVVTDPQPHTDCPGSGAKRPGGEPGRPPHR